MGYLNEFQTQIANHDYSAILRLWEEYCAADEADSEDLKEILIALKGSDFAEPFGKHVERILPVWEMIEESPNRHEVLKLIIDLQTSNNPMLGDLAYNYLQNRYADDNHFNDKIRLIGMRNREQFQGAISNYELLTHMEKGNYVFHTGGWGVGEIMEVSLVREQLNLEFDYVPGRKDLSFQMAFKTLIPVPKDHFLAMRFGNPDELEKKAKETPVEVIRILLRDLGPKTASEIKDELCELVIPAAEWTRWWQNARAKIKKDTMIASPEELKDPFRLRRSEVTHEERLAKALENKPDVNTLIQMVYSFMKDFPETLKNVEFKATLTLKLMEFLSFQQLTDSQELQIHFFLEDMSNDKNYPTVIDLVKSFNSVEEIINGIEIQSFKKRTLTVARKAREDWTTIFLNLIFTVDQNPLRDYLFNELLASEAAGELKKKLEELYSHPSRYPEALLWYFQKIMANKNLPFTDQEGKNRFFEAFLILLSYLEQTSEREMIKKIHSLLSGGRYAIVRQIMQGAGIKEVQEFLLLATKCHSLSDHDIKILHSLAEVVHPSLQKVKKKHHGAAEAETNEIWTTQEGFHKLQNRIQQIATVETVENAKEIEVARSHGDLRENAEFKSALEKRDRLQGELKVLSEQLNRARVLTKDDISLDEVCVGSIVECISKNGETITYTILGPWDADPDKFILSFQSKLAQQMKGLTKGDKFKFQGDEFTVVSIRSVFE